VYHIDRGYENIEEKLRHVGAEIRQQHRGMRSRPDPGQFHYP
jgi:hypothetical protein